MRNLTPEHPAIRDGSSSPPGEPVYRISGCGIGEANGVYRRSTDAAGVAGGGHVYTLHADETTGNATAGDVQAAFVLAYHAGGWYLGTE